MSSYKYFMEMFDFNSITENCRTSGYVMGGMPETTGFVYKVLPLTFNLLQNNNGRKIPEEARKCPKFFVGQYIKGISIYDKKEHKGIITRILYKDSKPLVAYVVDKETSEIIPILIKSAKKLKSSGK